MQTIDDFDKSDWDSFHDTLSEAWNEVHGNFDCEFDHLTLRALFQVLPENVQNTAFEWSLGDTVFRDEAYEFYVKNPAFLALKVVPDPLPASKRECPHCGALQVIRIVKVGRWGYGDPDKGIEFSASEPVYRCGDCEEEWTDWQGEVIRDMVSRHCATFMEYPETFDRNAAPQVEGQPGRYVIRDPKELMTPEDRAFQMWAVHPLDLDRLGMTREEFYLAHVKASARYG